MALTVEHRLLGGVGDRIPSLAEWEARRQLRRLRADRERWAVRDAEPGSWASFEGRRFSQNGEDGLIAALVDRIGAPGRWFVEIGAADGGENCTRALAEDGWSGIWFEGDPSRAALARSLGLDRVRVVEAMVHRGNATELLDAHQVPVEPDVVVVDIDGDDRGVLAAVLEHRRPRVLVVEYNAAYPPPAAWALPERAATGWDGTDRFGASLQALVDTAREHELVLCDRAGVNALFVRKDLAAGLDLPRSPGDAFRMAGHSRHPFGHVRSRAAVAAPDTIGLGDAAAITLVDGRLEGPSSVAPGGVVGLSLMVRNDGTVTLRSGRPGGFSLVLRWADGDEPPTPDAARTPLAHPVPPGATRREVLWIDAPTTLGRHRLRVTGVVEGVAWLEVLDGAGRTVDLEVTVAG
jgi:hypothetical protein